ncbi:MAG: 16S rRNA (uracil(1498)-N(3))-methyltransferase [Lachnospiraceae bacterium]|nr:16S rRNA (uracil(1498)-N(3))-methyltransferase [Lachnospiraceae bacterium]
MNRFFVTEEQLKSEIIRIVGEDYNHIRNVLRMKQGEEVLLSSGGDKEYLCTIVGYTEEEVLLQITDVFGNARELPTKITLFQGYPKGDKMETIVQKAVELGVYEIIPVMMRRCVVKLDEKKASKKVERLNAIALNAAKQSKRGIVPCVRDVMNLADAVKYASDMDLVILPYENAEGMNYAREVIASVNGKSHIGVFIGPEGGFEASEVEQIEAIGGKTISLGHRILRTETAGMTILSLLMFQLEKDEK